MHLLGVRGILLSAHQSIKLLQARLINLDLGEPTTTSRIILRHLVNDRRLLLERRVDHGNLALDGTVDVGGGLDGLDGADGIASRHPVTVGLGELDVDDVTEGFGGVFGDADDARQLLAVDVDPFVVFCVALFEDCFENLEARSWLANWVLFGSILSFSPCFWLFERVISGWTEDVVFFRGGRKWSLTDWGARKGPRAEDCPYGDGLAESGGPHCPERPSN